MDVRLLFDAGRRRTAGPGEMHRAAVGQEADARVVTMSAPKQSFAALGQRNLPVLARRALSDPSQCKSLHRIFPQHSKEGESDLVWPG
jgi:hypothetical protein